MGRNGLSGSALKYIAMISMLLDHVGMAIFEYGLYYHGGSEVFLSLLQYPWWYRVYELCDFLRTAGRLAFPIYCFLLAEGFVHTRNRKRYFLNLLVFAVISEVPFDMAAFNSWWYPAYQNVFFELALGILVMEGLERAEREGLWGIKGQMMATASIIIGCGASLMLKADYDIVGILMIASFYLTRRDRKQRTIMAAVMGALETMGTHMGAGGLAAVPLWFYNGTRGKGNKWLPYWFYPLHLLALALLRSWLLHISIV